MDMIYAEPAASPDPTERQRRIAWLIIGVGAVLRIIRFAQGRALWLDEIFLANNILHRSWAGLFKPLDFRQGAPILFLLLEKIATTLFGDSERSMRTISLLAGMIALPLMWRVAQNIIGGGAALVAVMILALIEPAIYYSSEVKQYGSDLMATLLVIAMLLWLDAQPTRFRVWIGAVVVGIVAIFLSHPAVFVLAGGGASLIIARVLRKDWRAAGTMGFACAIWAGCFAANFVLFLRPLSADESLKQHWAAGFMPLSASAVPWLLRSYAAVFSGYETMWLDAVPLAAKGFHIGWLAAIVSIVGWIWMFKRSPKIAFVISMPIVMTILASATRGYAFEDRLVHFLVPIAILSLAAGLWRISLILPNGRLAAIALSCIILGTTAFRTAWWTLRPPRREEVPDVLAWIHQSIQPGDRIYVYHASDAPFFYYRNDAGLTNAPSIIGTHTAAMSGGISSEIAQLAEKPGRVWVVISHVGGDEDIQLVSALDRAGKCADHFTARGARGFLYDLKSR